MKTKLLSHSMAIGLNLYKKPLAKDKFISRFREQQLGLIEINPFKSG
jgi:hypothetical protein